MSKVREKRSTLKSGFVFDKILKIIRQVDDFGRFLNNFCNFEVFLARNKKNIPNNDCIEKVKIEKKDENSKIKLLILNIIFIIF